MRNSIFYSFEGSYKKVLCICSMGLLRSPTAAWVLSKEPFNFNTRSAGLDADALIRVDDNLISWADDIICMSADQRENLKRRTDKTIHCLNIRDNFAYRDRVLVQDLTEKLTAIYHDEIYDVDK